MHIVVVVVELHNIAQKCVCVRVYYIFLFCLSYYPSPGVFIMPFHYKLCVADAIMLTGVSNDRHNSSNNGG